jgi:hypothetical protein
MTVSETVSNSGEKFTKIVASFGELPLILLGVSAKLLVSESVLSV